MARAYRKRAQRRLGWLGERYYAVKYSTSASSDAWRPSAKVVSIFRRSSSTIIGSIATVAKAEDSLRDHWHTCISLLLLYLLATIRGVRKLPRTPKQPPTSPTSIDGGLFHRSALVRNSRRKHGLDIMFTVCWREKGARSRFMLSIRNKRSEPGSRNITRHVIR